MYLESNSRFVLFSSNDLLHFPLFVDDFSSWAILKKPIKNCQKIGGREYRKSSQTMMWWIYIHFCHATIFPALFRVIIYFWFNQLKLNFMCHTKTVFSSHFFRFIAWLSECMKNVDVLIYYMMYYKWIFAMYILCKVLL